MKHVGFEPGVKERGSYVGQAEQELRLMKSEYGEDVEQ